MNQVQTTSASVRKAAGVRRSKASIDLRQYTRGLGPNGRPMTSNQARAHFLDWAAQNYPHVLCPYGLIVQAETGAAKPYSENHQYSNAVRKSIEGIRRTLMEVYGRSLVLKGKEGIRASVNNDDAVEETVKTLAHRAAATNRRILTVEEKVLALGSYSNTARGRNARQFAEKTVENVRASDHEKNIKRLDESTKRLKEAMSQSE